MTHDKRPGGRSARVRRAVLDATVAMLGHDDARVTMAAIAREAGVQPSTVYRRWSSLALLVGDAVADLLARSSPLPDTGSLGGDVHAYAMAVAEDLAGPRGPAFLRAAVLIGSEPESAGRGEAVSGRTEQIEALLSRARERGEPVLDVMTFFETVLAPLYGYALFAPGALGVRAPALAERFLAEAFSSSARRRG